MDTYTNSVFSGYFADPHAMRHEGRWRAVGTGEAEDRVAGLVSDGLIEWRPWQPLDPAEALAAPAAAAAKVRAPEITRSGDRYHLRCSPGGADAGPRIPVADADAIEGQPRPDRGDDHGGPGRRVDGRRAAAGGYARPPRCTTTPRTSSPSDSSARRP